MESSFISHLVQTVCEIVRKILRIVALALLLFYIGEQFCMSSSNHWVEKIIIFVLGKKKIIYRLFGDIIHILIKIKQPKKMNTKKEHDKNVMAMISILHWMVACFEMRFVNLTVWKITKRSKWFDWTWSHTYCINH